MASAPVSKTGGSRFESWLPRFSEDSPGNQRGMVIGYVLFFVAGLGFGYAAPGRAKYVPFLFPIALALGAMFRDGVQGEIVLRLLLALIITGVGILLGRLLEERFEPEEKAGAA
jgi:hypothetical protein